MRDLYRQPRRAEDRGGINLPAAPAFGPALFSSTAKTGAAIQQRQPSRLSMVDTISRGFRPSERPQRTDTITYTTIAIESLNRVIRKSIKTRGSFPTEEAATKLIYLSIRSFEKTGRSVREWVAARNQFAILYPERFNK